MDRAIGFFTGLFAVLVIAAVVWLIWRKEAPACTYDERQLVLRGNGTRISFFVTLIAEALVLMFTELGVVPLESATLAVFAALMVGVVTFAVYCIRKDVFFRIGQNETRYMALCGVIVVLDGIVAGTRIADGSLLENGVPTFDGCNALVMALSFLVILVALFLRKRAGEEDE